MENIDKALDYLPFDVRHGQGVKPAILSVVCRTQ